jgi:hypothetical protein
MVALGFDAYVLSGVLSDLAGRRRSRCPRSERRRGDHGE